MYRSLLIAGAVVSALAIASPASAAKCVMAAGAGSGITADVAKNFATMALNNSIAAGGLKAKGKVSMACTTTLIVSECTAKQRACK
jgi:hypothetical protein